MSTANSDIVLISTVDFQSLLEAAKADGSQEEVFMHEGRILEFNGVFYNATLGTAASAKTEVQSLATTVERLQETNDQSELAGMILALNALIAIAERTEKL